MRTNLAFFAFLALTGVACGKDSTGSSTDLCAGSGAAATVTADNFAFTPASVTIAVGQSVCWQNPGTQNHTVTPNVSPNFNGSLLAGQTFVYTFTGSSNPSGFIYHCQQHSNMTATVIVN